MGVPVLLSGYLWAKPSHREKNLPEKMNSKLMKKQSSIAWQAVKERIVLSAWEILYHRIAGR
jgi:hypothetical protein